MNVHHRNEHDDCNAELDAKDKTIADLEKANAGHKRLITDIMALLVPCIADAALVGESYGPSDVLHVVEHVVARMQTMKATLDASEPAT